MNRIYPAWDELSDTHGELRELYEAMRTDLAEADAAATLMEAALYEAGEEFARQLAEVRKPDCRLCGQFGMGGTPTLGRCFLEGGPIVCINGDGYVAATPLRLYEKEESK